MAPVVSENFQSATSPSEDAVFEKYSSSINVEIDVFLYNFAKKFHQDEVCFSDTFEDYLLRHTMDRLKNKYRKYMQDSKAALEQTKNDHLQPESMLIKAECVKAPAKHQQPIVNRFGVGFRCCICFIKFKTREDLMSHREKTKHYPVLSEVYLRTPENRRPVSLFEMSPYSDSDDEMTIRRKRIELRNAGPPKAIKCSFCPREFIQKTHLEKHEEKHRNQNDQRKKPSTSIKHQQKAFKCTVCLKDFTSRLILSKHQRLHANQK